MRTLGPWAISVSICIVHSCLPGPSALVLEFRHRHLPTASVSVTHVDGKTSSDFTRSLGPCWQPRTAAAHPRRTAWGTSPLWSSGSVSTCLLWRLWEVDVVVPRGQSGLETEPGRTGRRDSRGRVGTSEFRRGDCAVCSSHCPGEPCIPPCRVEPGWTLVLAVPPPAGCAPLGPFASPSLTWLLAALSAMGSYVPWTRSGAPGVAAWLWQSPWDADPQWAPRLQGCRLSLLLAASERCFPLGAMCLAHSSPQTLPSREPGLRAACVLTPLDPQRADSLPPAHPLSPPAVPPPDPVVCGRLQPPSGLSVLCLHWPGRRRWQVLIDCHISKAGRERFKILSHPKQTD